MTKRRIMPQCSICSPEPQNTPDKPAGYGNRQAEDQTNPDLMAERPPLVAPAEPIRAGLPDVIACLRKAKACNQLSEEKIEAGPANGDAADNRDKNQQYMSRAIC